MYISLLLRKLRKISSIDNKQDQPVQGERVEAGDKLCDEQAEMHDTKGEIQIKHVLRSFNRNLPQQAQEHPSLLDKIQGGQEGEAQTDVVVDDQE